VRWTTNRVAAPPAADALEPWRDTIVAELGVPTPTCGQKTARMELTRYGHAMAMPAPGTLQEISRLRTSIQRQKLSQSEHPTLIFDAAPRLAFAHADWSGYSVFEEAFTRGHAAGMRAATTG
jgi:hypothetical protein